MYYLEDGYIRQYGSTTDGEVLFMHIYKPGSCFPLMWLFNDTPNRYYFEAVTDVTLRLAPASKVKEYFLGHIDVLEYFMERILLGLDGLLSRLESLVLDTAYAKTALLFLYLARSFGEENIGGAKIVMPLSHKQIASWIGTVRETASLQAEILKKKGLIQYTRRRYIVPSVAKLEKEVLSVQAILPIYTTRAK